MPPPASRRRRIVREAYALVRQVPLVTRGAVGFRDHGPAARLTVFIHGYFAHGGVLDPLASHLRASGLAVRQLHFTYPPLGSVAAHARALAAQIAATGHTGEVDVVAHSLGGLIARHYVQLLGGRVDRLVFLATPHHGTTRAAHWSALPLARDLCPGSHELARLAATAYRLDATRVCSVVASDDPLIAPVESCALEGHEVVWIDEIAHWSILFDARVFATVARVLDTPAASPERAPVAG